MKIYLKTAYANEQAHLGFMTYMTGQPAIQAWTTGRYPEPLMKLTLADPDVGLYPFEFIVKTYSENDGLLECLVEQELVKVVRWANGNPIVYPINEQLRDHMLKARIKYNAAHKAA